MVFGNDNLNVDQHKARFGAEVLTTRTPSLDWVFDELQSRGCQEVILEGGGNLVFQALQSNRLDEMYITICPLVIGGINAPSLADGLGFSAAEMRRLSLIECKQNGHELFLHYRILSNHT